MIDPAKIKWVTNNAQLKKMNVLMDDYCDQFCYGAMEDLPHALYHCPSIKESWNNLLSCLQPSHRKFIDIARQVRDKGSREDVRKKIFSLHGDYIIQKKSTSP